MSAPEITQTFPLKWVDGRPRTLAPKPALWRHDGRPVTMTVAKRRLIDQIRPIIFDAIKANARG